MWVDKLVEFVNRHKTLQNLKNFFEVFYIKTPVIILIVISVIIGSCIFVGNGIHLGVYDSLKANQIDTNTYSIVCSKNQVVMANHYNNIFLYTNSDERFIANIISVEGTDLIVSCPGLINGVSDKNNITAIIQVDEQTVWQRIFHKNVGD